MTILRNLNLVAKGVWSRSNFKISIRSVSQAEAKIDRVKTFDEIPAPPGGQLPFFGHSFALIKKPAGFAQSWRNVLEFKKKYVPPGVEMLRLNLPVSNPEGDGRVVLLFQPDDIQHVYRNEGKYPNRGPGFECFKAIRERRPDLFATTTGLLTEEGEDWHTIRAQVQQDMMRPKSALFYIDKLQDVGDDLAAFIRRERDKDDLTIPDFLLPAQRFALESITAIALDSRLGCLDLKISDEVLEFMTAIDNIMKKFPGMLTEFPTWKFFPPRWSSLFRAVEDNNNVAFDFVKKKLGEAADRFQSHGDNDSDDLSVMEKLIRRNGKDAEITHVMALDMISAGIDTTGNTFAFMMYNLAINPDKQDILRKEIQSFGGNRLTVQDVGKMRYFRACLNENFRMTPTISYMGRLLPNEIVIRNYKIPAKSLLMWNATIMGKNTELFPNPEQFVPERWLNKRDEIHPFTLRQFSHGPRMCIGKRFAELEIQLGVCKLVQNFEITWAGDEEIQTKTELVNIPDKPVKLKFKDIGNKI